MAKTREDHIKAAGEAMADINTFGIIEQMIDGGGILNGGYSIEIGEKIAKLCRQAIQKACRDYDHHSAAAAK